MEARERFEQRHQAQRNSQTVQDLQRAREAKTQLAELNADPAEDQQRFDAAFKARIESITSQVQALDAQDVLARCEALRTDTLTALGTLNAAAHFLHPHTIKQCREAIQQLHDNINSAQERLQPRKKFAFKAKVATRKAEEAPVAPLPAFDVDFQGIADVSGQTVVKDAEELEAVSCFQLKNLVDCTVVLPGVLQAVHILNIQRCTLYIGAVAGAVHVTHCEESSVSLSCHQLRIHQSRASVFYVDARTPPIVEDVQDLAFAPYNFTYPGCQPVEGNMWRQVKDFKWLKTEHSPNWRELPLEERRHYSLI